MVSINDPEQFNNKLRHTLAIVCAASKSYFLINKPEMLQNPAKIGEMLSKYLQTIPLSVPEL